MGSKYENLIPEAIIRKCKHLGGKPGENSNVEENLGVMEASLMVGSLWKHTSAVRSIMSDAVVLNTEYWNPLGSFKNTCVLAAPRLRGPRH